MKVDGSFFQKKTKMSNRIFLSTPYTRLNILFDHQLLSANC